MSTRCSISGVIPSLDNLVVFQPKAFALQKIDLLLGTEVVSIDHKVRQVVIRKPGRQEDLPYDALVIASGSEPVKPSIKDVDNPNVKTLRTMDDARNIMQSAQSVKSAVIIGASFIGLELAEALKIRGLAVTLIEKDYILWRILDEDICRIVKDTAIKHGITIQDRSQSRTYAGKEKETVNDLSAYSNALVVITAGVRPDVKVARDDGIAIGPTGGIKTNQYLQTNIPDIYAAGDCAESV
ncbi:MAG: FAD-dependent oxidoreductase [Planctomycetes bacterium]|nr:FAD-dependent oxidoreductase [Planctomycetota bacterium]